MIRAEGDSPARRFGFLIILLFIAGATGIVLAVLNASSKPAATTPAIIYGVLGLAFLVGGFLLVRKRRY